MAEGKNMRSPAFQFYPDDYMRDTRILSLQGRGAWTDLLCIMWFSQEKGKCNGDVTQMKRCIFFFIFFFIKKEKEYRVGCSRIPTFLFVFLINLTK